MKRFTTLAATVTASLLAMLTSCTPTPPPPATYTKVATHPQAAAQTTASGKRIHDLEVHNGQLIAGYGDYNVNTGPITVNPLTLSSMTFQGGQITVGTEEINVLRKINGALYIPLIDPRTAHDAPTGYATNVSGTWKQEDKVAMVHVYDIAERVPGELWMVGAANAVPGVFGGAVAYRSTNGGTTWQLMRHETDALAANQDGFERYYWIAAMNGKVYMQASDVVDAPLRAYDGTTWTTITSPALTANRNTMCYSATANEVIAYNGTLYCSGFGGDLMTLKNGIVASYDNWLSGGTVQDWHIGEDGLLYALSSLKGILRTAQGSLWQNLASASQPWVETPESIAVHGDRIYLGGANANIYRSDRTITALAAQESFLYLDPAAATK